jgi:hypothetical protein
MGPVCLEVDPGAGSQLITLSIAVTTASNWVGDVNVGAQVQLFPQGRPIHDFVLVLVFTGG